MAKEAAEASKDQVSVVEVVPVVASVATSRERKRSARELPLAQEGRTSVSPEENASGLIPLARFRRKPSFTAATFDPPTPLPQQSALAPH